MTTHLESTEMDSSAALLPKARSGATTGEHLTTTPPAGRPRGSGARRRWLAVLLVGGLAAVGALGGLALSYASENLFGSEAVVRVYNPYRLSGSQFGQVDQTTIVTLEQQYAESKATRTAAREALEVAGVGFERVEWSAQPEAATVTVRCHARSAEDSAACAETFAATYVSLRQKAIAKPLRRQVAALTTNLKRLNRQIDAIQRRVDRTPPVDQATSDSNRGRLAKQSSLLTQASEFTTDRQMLKSQAGTLAQNYQLVTPPEVPVEGPLSTTLRNVAVGLVAGLLLGLAVLAGLTSPRGRWISED